MNISSIRDKLLIKQGQLKTHLDIKKKLRREIKGLENKSSNIVQAIYITQEVATATQQQLQLQICEIITAAIQTVFQQKHTLKIDFISKRNKSEAHIYLEDEGGNELNLFNDDGGGLLDIVAFLLKITCWRISAIKSAPIFIFDEPFRNLSKEYQPKVSEFIKEISQKLNIQFIIITHIQEFIENADNIIKIED